MLLLAYVILRQTGIRPLIHLSQIEWILLVTGSLIILVAYMKDFTTYVIDYKQSFPSSGLSLDQLIFILSVQFMPRVFDWLLFCAGVFMHLTAVLLIVTGRRKGSITD